MRCKAILHFEGEVLIDEDIDRVWDIISNPEEIIKCVPGIQEYKLGEGKNISARVKAGIGFIKGMFSAKSTVLEEEPEEHHAKLSLNGTGMGGAFNSTVDLDLEERNGKTAVKYKADVKMSGALATIASRMIEGAVKKMVDQIFSCVKKTLER